MKCEICKKNEATIHQTIIVNGHKEETHFCEECSQKGLAGIGKAFSMEDFFGAFLAEEPKTIEPKCKSCGMTIEKFKQTGRLGCENCYSELREYILPVIENVHGRTTHVGKTTDLGLPNTNEVAEADKEAEKEVDQIALLNAELNRAIDTEDYENAAIIRDRIKELKGLSK